MAPRLIPPEPVFASTAEQVLWSKLRSQLPAEAFLAANRALQSHEDFYEADLVVGLPGQGFVVIEVKGGRVWHTDEGWAQATRDGVKAIDPAGQADRAKRLLDSYVRRRGWTHGPIRFEHLVSFPDTEFDDAPPSPDLARWALIAKNDLEDAAARIWDALDHRVTDKPRPTAAWVADMADLLGGRPEPASTLLGVAEARAEHVRLLTEAQYSVLRMFRTNPCIRVIGGPGTGKTWLALEQARTWAKDGQQVLFVCYSRGLARWVQQAVLAMGEQISRRITVRTFHAHGVASGIDVPPGTTQEWWDVTLPALMMERAVVEFDALVVDEAQDFADSWWPPLLAALRHQRMFVAGDERQTVFPGRQGHPAVDLVEMVLDENLRNTTQIAGVFNPLASERMRFRGGDGLPVRFVPCSADAAYDVADAEVERLLGQGHDPGSIAVLTTKNRHPYHRAAEEHGGKDHYWDGFWMDDEVFYGTVMGFKGLERPAVVLAVDGFRENVGRDVMYAGLSRPRDMLVVCGDLEMIRSAVGDEVCKRLTASPVDA